MSILLLFINLVGNFVATVVFSLAGCMMAETMPLMISFFPAMICSHGGGFCRDAYLWVAVSKEAIPAVAFAYANWAASILGFLLFAILKRKKKLYCLIHGRIKWARTFFDYGGVGQFLVSGIVRARSYGVNDPIALTLLGSITALGGGLISLVLFRSNKREAIKSNILYYLTVLVSSAIVANISNLDVMVDFTTLITSVICSFVGISGLYLSESSRASILLIGHSESTARKIGLWVSPGTLFQKVKDPTKGIHLFISISRTVGTQTSYQFIFSAI